MNLLPFVLSLSLGQVDSDGLARQPISTAKGPVGDLLRKWWQEGTAAGNVGDFYDNRDREHSNLNLGPYPQLQKLVYPKEDLDAKRDWAARRTLAPGVVFGNSSTSAPAHLGGSNVRSYYVSPQGLTFLHQQYTHNNLYIYPEHRDHDPGHNGKNEAYGDLFPTNTPYLLCSQGSSGSDQPFMRALPFTLAAFRPEVKKKLIETGLLMPTVQMILRKTSKLLNRSEDYFTGLAHPTVFEGKGVDELAMIKLAHEIDLLSIPPLVQLKVLEEDHPVRGKDFFETRGSEMLGDTPCVIARVWRGKEYRRRLVVSAADSKDPNDRPLKFTWTILRGDPEKIQIKPLKDNSSVAEITLSYHPRRPIAPGSSLESNRVDLGVFAHNGAYPSAPAFITYFSLDSEARVYDEQDRIQEISYRNHYVDHRLAAPKNWRDRYRYHPDGTWLGWTRHLKDQTQDFDAEGRLVLKRDSLDRPLQVRPVRYVQDPQEKPGPYWKPLRTVPEDLLINLVYDGDNDRKGRIGKEEKAPAEK